MIHDYNTPWWYIFVQFKVYLSSGILYTSFFLLLAIIISGPSYYIMVRRHGVTKGFRCSLLLYYLSIFRARWKKEWKDPGFVCLLKLHYEFTVSRTVTRSEFASVYIVEKPASNHFFSVVSFVVADISRVLRFSLFACPTQAGARGEVSVARESFRVRG